MKRSAASVGRTATDVRAGHGLEGIWASSPLGLVETDLEQRIVDCNPAFAAMVGRCRDDVVGKHGWSFFHPDGPAAEPQAVVELLAGRRSGHSVERLLRAADGRPLAVKLDWSVIRDGDGAAVGLACFVTDISALASTAAALEAARARAQVLWDRAPVGIIEGTPDGVIATVNDAALAMLGRTRQELVGSQIAALSDPAYAPEIDASLTRLLAGRVYSADRLFLHADGRSVPVQVSTAVLRDDDGRVARLVGFLVDMSVEHARRDALALAMDQVAAAKAELEVRQAFTDAVLDTVQVGIVSTDAAGGGVIGNRAMRAILGLGDEPGGAWPQQGSGSQVCTEDGRPLSPDQLPLARALRGEPVEDLELRIGPPRGTLRDVLVNARQMHAPDGSLLGAVMATTDVSAAREATRQLAEERQRLAQAKTIGRLGSFSYDVVARTFTASPHLRHLWGLPQEGPVEDLARAATHSGDTARTAAAFATALAEGGRHTWTFRIHRLSDGALRHLSSTVEVVHDDAGRPLAVKGIHQDVTDLVEAEQQAVRATALFEAILSASPDWTFITDLATGEVVYGSPGKQIVGLTTEQLQELGPEIVSTLIHPDDRQRVRATDVASGALRDGEVLQIRFRVRHPDGTWHWLSRRGTPFRRDEATGEVLEVLGVLRDVTDVVRAEEELTHAALHDPLTGLPNRALLMDRLEKALGRARQLDRDIAVLFCDLDGFKRVNDTAGHAAGDEVLTETAGRLRNVLRDTDTLARVGGDEFVIIVEPWRRPRPAQDHHAAVAQDDHAAVGADDRSSGADLHHEDPADHPAEPDARELAAAISGRVISALRTPILVDGTEHRVGVSIGITCAGSSRRSIVEATPDRLLHEADAAMYRAKERGKDCYEDFELGPGPDTADNGRP